LDARAGGLNKTSQAMENSTNNNDANDDDAVGVSPASAHAAAARAAAAADTQNMHRSWHAYSNRSNIDVNKQNS
jgi:hypothetical protein